MMKKTIVILVHAFVLWALCAATIGIGMTVTSVENAIIAHAILAPVIAVIVSVIYFNKFNYTTALQTAVVFVAFIIIIDFFVVALLINKSFDMFMSPLGTWIPFVLIFTATYLTGIFLKKTFSSFV